MVNPLWCLGVAAVLLRGTDPGAHPLHTTYTEIAQSTIPGRVRLTIRGFEDDLATASRPGRPGGSIDTAIVEYLQRRMVLTDARGRRVPLALKELHRTPDVLWVTFQSTNDTDLTGARLTHAVLTDRHDDQVNLVQVKLGGSTRTLLFTPGDGARPLGG